MRHKLLQDMNTLSIRDFRSNLASSFDKVDAGERVLIRRNRKIYTIVSVEEDDLTITPALAKKIEDARRAHQNGETIKCGDAGELKDFLAAL